MKKKKKHFEKRKPISLLCESFSYQTFFLVIGRKIRPRITFLMFMQMFVLGLLGLVLFSLHKSVVLGGLRFPAIE
jgi:hypothetical protein